MSLTLTIENQSLTLEVPTIPAMTLSVSTGQGPSGASSSHYASRVDTVSSTLIYRGEANAGSLDSAASWRIQKIVIAGEDITITWANGTNNFDKVWDNRLSYTYS